MTEAMRFLRLNVSGHVSMNTALEPGRIHIEISDSAGHPGLRWFVTPCDLPRLQECLNAATAHYQGDATVPPPAEPPAAGAPPPGGGGGEPATAAITSISNASPAVVTIGEADFANFAESPASLSPATPSPQPMALRPCKPPTQPPSPSSWQASTSRLKQPKEPAAP